MAGRLEQSSKLDLSAKALILKNTRLSYTHTNTLECSQQAEKVTNPTQWCECDVCESLYLPHDVM